MKKAISTALLLVSLSSGLIQAKPTTTVAEAAANAATSLSCIDYEIAGICLWLHCTTFFCTVRESLKVKHYVPDAVVQVYIDTQERPLADVDTVLPTVTGSVNNTAKSQHNFTARRMKSADAFGNPMSSFFSSVFGDMGFVCNGGAKPYHPYFYSDLDFAAWRMSIPESFYPESWNVFDNIDNVSTGTWGYMYPRNGFIIQSDDYKASAVIAQRVGDIITRSGEPHVYKQIPSNRRDGYWPPPPLQVGDKDTGKWQMILPNKSDSCIVFPDSEAPVDNRSGKSDYVWNLWRPYSCCQRMGQTFLESIDF